MSKKNNVSSLELAQSEDINESSLIEIGDGLLFDARAEIMEQKVLSVPISQLTTLGASVSSLHPALRTITETSTVHTSGLYKFTNMKVGDTLKQAKNGNYWGAFKTAEGTSKLGQLKAVDSVKKTTKTVAPINPATMMMAVALFSIEQKLGEIEKMQQQIISFLEIEKESEVEADVETLFNIISKYKFNWDNEHFIASNHKLVLDIQRTARKNMNGYEKKVINALNLNKFQKPIMTQTQINSTLKNLQKNFKYYRLSLYVFSLACMIEIMLSGNFNEEYISSIKEEIEKLSSMYRDLFGKCSIYIEKISGISIEANVLKGVGTVSNTVGRLIDNIPLVKEVQLGDFLQDSGKQIKTNAKDLEIATINEFAEISNPETRVFIEKMDDMIQIYNHTNEICFDDKMIYLIVE
ncbi:hypothetical protein LJB88_01675 [Erysipelotrichaceae bacterium OttesenSCG-928-M19]|nr:hypothetical protein [Erysipelotrichaceae bacterium OttesenSCG-928-M19]